MILKIKDISKALDSITYMIDHETADEINLHLNYLMHYILKHLLNLKI